MAHSTQDRLGDEPSSEAYTCRPIQPCSEKASEQPHCFPHSLCGDQTVPWWWLWPLLLVRLPPSSSSCPPALLLSSPSACRPSSPPSHHRAARSSTLAGPTAASPPAPIHPHVHRQTPGTTVSQPGLRQDRRAHGSVYETNPLASFGPAPMSRLRRYHSSLLHVFDLQGVGRT